MILANTTRWTDAPMVDRAIYQRYQMLEAVVPKIAKEQNQRGLINSDEMPNNPKMAMEIILDLNAKQKQEGNAVYESYLTAVKTNKEAFAKYAHQQLADQLPELRPVGSTTERQPAGHMEASASGSSTSIVSSLSSAKFSQTLAAAGTEGSASKMNQVNPMQVDILVIVSDDMATPREDSSNISISQT